MRKKMPDDLRLQFKPATPYQKRRGIHLELELLRDTGSGLVTWPYTGTTEAIAGRLRSMFGGAHGRFEDKIRRWQNRVLIPKRISEADVRRQLLIWFAEVPVLNNESITESFERQMLKDTPPGQYRANND